MAWGLAAHWVSSQGSDSVPARSLTCHTVRYNRNVCVPLTLERQSVNSLTCEIAHRIRGAERPCHVQWGGKGGGRRARPSRSAHPTGTTQPATEQPPDTDTTHGASHHGTPPTTTRPNLNNQREPQPRPRVENNQTRTQPARQATRKTSRPPSEKNCNPQDTHQPTAATTQQRDDPNQEPQHTKRPGGGVKEGSQGNKPPHVTPPTPQEPDPTKQTPPPTRHPNLRTQPHPETRHQSKDPPHPPTTPPPTPHQVPCTHAMGHIQPTPTLANKLEQTQETSPRKSKLQMRRPRPSHHPTTYQQRGTQGDAPVAPPGMHHARNRRRPHHRRRQPRTK